jgi:hypothetical protein
MAQCAALIAPYELIAIKREGPRFRSTHPMRYACGAKKELNPMSKSLNAKIISAGIAGLVAAAAVAWTLVVVAPATAQQCASDKKRAQAQACIIECRTKFPKEEKSHIQKRMACQDACILKCR